MRMRPIVLAATVAALALSGAPAQAGGSGSINRLKTLNAARDRAIAQGKKATAAAEADFQAQLKKDKEAARLAAKAAMVRGSGPMSDRKVVAAIDSAYQDAVKTNNYQLMDRILGDDLAVVLGDGTTVTRTELLSEAQSGTVQYEQQDEVAGTRSVRVWNDTAVVTALLWVKGEGIRGPFDTQVWFSSTYMRMGDGWRYVFGQVSLPIQSAPGAAPPKVDTYLQQNDPASEFSSTSQTQTSSKGTSLYDGLTTNASQSTGDSQSTSDQQSTGTDQQSQDQQTQDQQTQDQQPSSPY